ncbi:MAG: hypothetical protein IT374_23450 [Polyangiaceae bacterium]|nr:hypothetical protein [Polyangiaceae bacterium]
MQLHAPLVLAQLALSPVVAVATPEGQIALLDPSSLATRRTLPAEASALFADGRRLFVVEPGHDGELGAVRALDVGARVEEAWRADLEGDAFVVTARGAGVLLGRVDAGAYLGVVGGAGRAVAPPSSVGDTGAWLWSFREQDGWWTLDVHSFDGASLGPATPAGRVPAWGTGCGARAVWAEGRLTVVAPTATGVDLVSQAGVVHLASTQPCVEDAVSLGGGQLAVLMGPVAELVATVTDRPWRLDAQLAHSEAPTRRLSVGVREHTLLVATGGPLLELDLARGDARWGGVDAAAVAVLR